MLDFLPSRFLDAIQKLNMNNLFEVRLRAGKPTTIRTHDGYVYLGEIGIVKAKQESLMATYDELEEAVFVASQYSVYAIEEQLKQGFITGKNGERIGIAGRGVYDGGKLLTIRDYSSLCIRIPHEIIGAANETFEQCFSKGISNVLIVAPPGQGKTTILRDLSRILCERRNANVLICDERGEIGVGNVGESADVFAFTDKRLALEMGVRVMRPEVILTDELTSEDLPFVIRAKCSGVKVVASYHAERIDEVPESLRKTFDKIVLIDNIKIGKIISVITNEVCE